MLVGRDLYPLLQGFFMITKYIKGDICDTELKYIAHGVNCQNKMGSGVAKALYERFPEVKTEYHRYNKYNDCSETRLAHAFKVESGDKVIYNCYTQLNFGYDGKKYVNYAAVSECFGSIKCWIKGEIIAIPKIGCGFAGGNWEFMEQLINDTVGEDLEIWVYEK